MTRPVFRPGSRIWGIRNCPCPRSRRGGSPWSVHPISRFDLVLTALAYLSRREGVFIATRRDSGAA